MWDPFANFESAVLSNGLTIYASHWPDRSWQHVNFLIHSGADQDLIGREGTAHFMEHLVSENGMFPQFEMQKFLRKNGGNANFGSTAYPHTYYQFSLPAMDSILTEGLMMFGSMLLHAQLEKYIERERAIIFGEFRQYFPSDYKHELEVRKNRAIHRGNTLERMALALGTLESIANITQGDLQTYYDTHYTPANMSIVCVGGKTLNEMVALLSDSPFADLKKGIRTVRPAPTRQVSAPLDCRYTYRQSDYISTPVEVGEYHSFAKIPGTFSQSELEIFSRALGEKLFEEVRLERAWTYHIQASGTPYAGFFQSEIQAMGVRLDAMDSIEKVIDFCVSEVGTNTELFHRTQEATIAETIMLDTTGNDICYDAMQQISLYGRIESLQEQMDSYRRVAFQDMQDLSRLLAPHMRHTQLALP